MTPKTCVVHVLETPKTSTDIFAAAQQLANQLHLPMAVVHVMPDWDQKLAQQLTALEAELDACNIPLIVLIGNPANTLAGFMHHTNPYKIFRSSDNGYIKDTTSLEVVDVVWPGVVIPLSQLAELAAQGKLAC